LQTLNPTSTAMEISARAAQLTPSLTLSIDSKAKAMKAEGIDYDERMELLGEVSYPKPLDELLRAALARWEVVATDDVIAEIEASPGSPAEKVRRLFAHVTASSEQHPGQLRLLGCAGQPDVAAALQRTTTRRIGYVARLLCDTGLTPAVASLRATLAYAAYLGHAQLAHTTPGVLPRTSRARSDLIDELATVLLG